MKITEFRKLIREEVRKVIKEVDIEGDINNMDTPGKESGEIKSYLKTPEGKRAISIFKALVSKSFNNTALEKAIRAGKFKTMNHFRGAAVAGGLEIEGFGTVDNKGNGDFQVDNSNYKDNSVIVFFDNEFDGIM